MKKIIPIILFLLTAEIVTAQIPVLWGMTQLGGAYGVGAILKVNGDGSGFEVVHSFQPSTGDSSSGSLFEASNGLLYGMTQFGGLYEYGVIFSVDPSNNKYTDIYDFDDVHGSYPLGNLTRGVGGKLFGMTTVGGGNGRGTIFSFDPSNNTYSKLFDFSKAIGYSPYGSPFASIDGKLYGMTYAGGTIDSGVIFSFNPTSGAYKDLHNFIHADGISPTGDLFQLSSGLLYGMTSLGGKYNLGTLFSIDTAGNNYSVLHDFEGIDSTDGATPYGNLIETASGKLFGMTPRGGFMDSGYIFWYDPVTGNYSDSLFFDFEDVPNGAKPIGSLLQGSDGLLYGMTSFGGPHDNGVIFSIDTLGRHFNDVHYFTGADGDNAIGNLIQLGTTSGIGQLSINSNQFSIYPNPGSGLITITSSKTIDNLEVNNVLGQLIYQAHPHQTHFTFELKNEGMYFVTISSGGETETKKIAVCK